MFGIGIAIFLIYVYFLLSVIRKQHKHQRKNNKPNS
jgi:hypothetical protein